MSGLWRRALRSLDRVLDRAPLVVLGAAILAAAALGYTLPNLRINTSTEEMISAEVPFRRNHLAFLRAFPAFRDTIVAVVEGEAPERVERAAIELAVALRADAEHFSAVDYPASDPFFATHGLLYLELDELDALTGRLAAAQPLLAVLAENPDLHGIARFVELAVREEATAGTLPDELDRLFGAMAETVDAQLAARPRVLSWRAAMEDDRRDALHRELVVAEPRFNHPSMAPAAAAIEAVRAHARAIGIAPERGLRLSLTGEAVLDHEELQSVRAGALLAASLTTVSVAGLLVMGLRSLRLIAAVLITLAVGLVLTAALATLAIGRLNLISVTFAVLFVGLGVDFGIHLVLRYREAASHDDHRRALHSAMCGVAGALTLSALCATFGFLAFVPTDYRGLAELGIISAFGMAIAWLTSLTLLPALLEVMPLRAARLPPPGPTVLARLQHHPRPVVAAAVGGALISLIALPALSFDFNPLNLKDPESESVRTFKRLAEDRATSPHVVEVLADSLEEAERIARRLGALDVVDRAITLADFVPSDQAEKLELIDALALYLGPVLQMPIAAKALGPEERARAIRRLQASLDAALARDLAPEDESGAARLAGALRRFAEVAGDDPAALAELSERLTGTLPYLFERLRQALEAGPVTLADLPESLRSRWGNAEGQARVLVRPATRITGNAALETFARAVLDAEPRATGTPIIVMEAGRAVVAAFEEASWLALGLITGLLVVVLRRLAEVLLILLPLGLAVLLTGATAVVLDLSLNFANVIVLPLLLGLGVSGAIHVVLRWRERREPASVAATSTPRAVLFSALTTIASFGSLAVSPHRGLASMGLLLTIAILWSLVSTLIVLPSLLALARRSDGSPVA